ncbi:hypothetical protein M422DRAFT_32230 [Sphaerobolus stellatus SS14]|uniref:Uncharacterized protein n=1 Tax=Sphaerobolus stellatus (strain SS14) TaxID=990650 RepID=A0A0C9UBU9_SPHS4|nr:hypothetical protein M422DRAFT_32230 [Sphaerobolus stellatus SS14]
MGSLTGLPQIFSERTIRRFHLIEASTLRTIPRMLDLLVEGRWNIREFDLMYLLDISEEQLELLANLWPNVEVLALARSHKKSAFIDILNAITPFHGLNRLTIQVHFISMGTMQWHPDKGWIYLPETNLKETKSAAACELDPNDELTEMLALQGNVRALTATRRIRTRLPYS